MNKKSFVVKCAIFFKNHKPQQQKMNQSINNLPLIPQSTLDETYNGREVIYRGRIYFIWSALQTVSGSSIWLILSVSRKLNPISTKLVEFTQVQLK